ncbi:MAG: protein TolR [Gammaproteobacteria bacterium]|nr:protein TolR [Gammaproteobacteria bacterium]
MSEINVVPYIDVMLVLLIIFMVTAPLITQGVKIDLPQAPSEVLPPSDDEPVVVSVDAAGLVYVDLGETPDQAIDDDTLMTRIAAVLRYKPKTDVLVEGDRGVDYGRVVEVMTLLKNAGVASVGLITEPPAE